MKTLHRIHVSLAALAFAALGLVFWFAPGQAGAALGLEATGAAGLTTLRADLGGLFVGLGLLAGAGVWTGRRAALLAATMLLATVVVGRAIGGLAGGALGGRELALELGVLVSFALGARHLGAAEGRQRKPSQGQLTHRKEQDMKKGIAVTLLVTLGAIGAAGVAGAAGVRYDYDKSIDFTKYESFAWQQPGEPHRDNLALDRIEKALEAGFVADGYEKAASPAEADFLIAYHAAARRDLRLRESFRGPGFGRDLRADAVPVGVLVVDVIDAESGELAWRGRVEDALASNPEKADRKVAKAVAKLLEKFPPAAKSH
jgi:hypothetical protein